MFFEKLLSWVDGTDSSYLKVWMSLIITIGIVMLPWIVFPGSDFRSENPIFCLTASGIYWFFLFVDATISFLVLRRSGEM